MSQLRSSAGAGGLGTLLIVFLVALAGASASSWRQELEQAPFFASHPPEPGHPHPPQKLPLEPRELDFTLRHVFHRGTKLYPSLHRRLDVNPAKVRGAVSGEASEETGIGPYRISPSAIVMPRLRERSAEVIQSMMSAAQTYGSVPLLSNDAWSLDEIPSPNITDKGTVVNFALMAGSAYNRDRTDPEWEETRPPFNLSSDIGWENDGIRGHVFADATNSTLVVAVKGTSRAIFDGAETTTNDKENDNLFAGCCCGQGGSYLLRQVCDCQTSTYACNDTCVTKALRAPNRYYHSALELYGNITEMYPDANVWMTGHSLGGLVSSLLGLTFGLPTVTFEAIPQALAAERLFLPVPPGYSSVSQARKDAGIYNFGHTADPVYEGTCHGGTSLCALAGYALESHCHVGQRCVYDTVKDRKWRQSLSTHGIRAAIRDVYRDYDDVPDCVPDDECIDCGQWKRYHSNSSDSEPPSSSSSSSAIATSTTTCRTPGWWGCRDETSTTSSSTQTTDNIATTTTFTTTDPPVTTTTQSSSLSTSTCETPGWWGCRDKTTQTSTPFKMDIEL